MSEKTSATAEAAKGASSALSGLSVNTIILVILAFVIVLLLAYFLGKARRRPDHPKHDLPAPEPPKELEPSDDLSDLLAEHESQWRRDGIADGRTTAEIEQALKEKLNRHHEN